MRALGAVFGSIYGWERPNFFAPPGYGLGEAELDKPDTLLNENHPAVAPGERPREKWSFRRSNYFRFVGDEVKNVAENVGLQDMSAFAKAFVSGPGAEAWLDSIFANRVPKKVGRIGLCHLLTTRGGVRSEFTVYRARADGFYLVSAGAWERHDHDVLQKLLPADGSVRFHPVTTAWGVLVVAGPRSRELLQRVTDTDLSPAAFPWLTGKPVNIGPAEAHALRVNFVGELGWELHHPIEMQNTIFDILFAAGQDLGLKPFGIRAMMAMALEKSYRLIGRELSIEYAALESGLDRFVQLNKGEFLGREALTQWRERGFGYRFVSMEVHGVTDADARGSEPILLDGEMVGRCTSGGYGWRTGKSLALGMVRPEFGEIGQALTVTILGDDYRATVIPELPYDPDNARLKS